MSTVSVLQQIATKLKEVESEVLEAENNRIKLTDRISQNFQAVKSNPNDEQTRKNLVEELEKDKDYLEVIRTHTKWVNTIFKIVKGELNKIKMISNQIKKPLRKTLDILSKTMKALSKKIKVLEIKISKGEELESKDYSEESLKKFEDILMDERYLDNEIYRMLKGTYMKEGSQLDAWNPIVVARGLKRDLFPANPDSKRSDLTPSEIRDMRRSGHGYTNINVPKTLGEINSSITDQHPQELQLIVDIAKLTLKFIGTLSRQEGYITQLDKKVYEG